MAGETESLERLAFFVLTIREAVATLDAIVQLLANSELDELAALATQAAIARDNVRSTLKVLAENDHA
jgi:hypothetical protein